MDSREEPDGDIGCHHEYMSQRLKISPYASSLMLVVGLYSGIRVSDWFRAVMTMTHIYDFELFVRKIFDALIIMQTNSQWFVSISFLPMMRIV